MAWTTPLTAVANSALTAAQWNASVRDNLLETAVAKATAQGQYFVATGTNTLAARLPVIGEVMTSQSTTSTSYTDLATVGPQVTVTTGTRALYVITTQCSHSAADNVIRTAVEVSGASSIAAGDTREYLVDGLPAGNAIGGSWVFLETGLTAGSNTFTMKYKVAAGTGTWSERRLIVIPF